MISNKYETHEYCRVCNSKNIELVIDFGDMPLAGGFMKVEEIPTSNIKYPLRLARCVDCTLMQIIDIVAPEKIFSQYSYASSKTQTMLNHFSKLGKYIVDAFSVHGKLVVEFGCNDGALIKPLIQSGAFPIGVDPSDVAKNASEEEGWTLINDYFNEKIANQIIVKYGKAKVIVGNNVFAHVNDLHTIMLSVDKLLDIDGVFLIEVCYQGELLNKIQYDTVYHEHIYYYSLTSLIKLFSKYDFRVIDVHEIPTHSGSIRVIASKMQSPWKQTQRVATLLEKEKHQNIKDFVKRVHHHRETFQSFINQLKLEGKRIGAYGASGRMTTLLNYCGLNYDLIDYIVDISPLRYDRIVPGILVPIVPPEVFHANLLDYMIMTAWNYETEILEKEQGYLKSGGKFIIPLPNVRIVG